MQTHSSMSDFNESFTVDRGRRVASGDAVGALKFLSFALQSTKHRYKQPNAHVCSLSVFRAPFSYIS